MRGFATEGELFDAVVESRLFRKLLDNGDSVTHVIVEPKGLLGVPDLLIAKISWYDDVPEVQAIAFELKLRDWRRGLRQAYRYRAFANRSYVVLDASNSHPAVRNIDQFARFNIGLVAIDPAKRAIIHYDPQFAWPYSVRQELNLHVGLLDLSSATGGYVERPYTFVSHDLRFAAID